MMTDDDRKKIFWLLKKYSSYTAWKALGDAFQAFTDEWELAVKSAKPPLDSDDFWVEALKAFWKGCDGFDKGLPMLKRGDRYIFTNNGNWLIFEEFKYAARLMNMDGYGEEYVHDWMVNKDDAFVAFKKIETFENCLLITEKKDLVTPATFKAETVFWTNTWPRHLDYAQFNFPPELDAVPESTATTIDSGKEVSITGIWEPEWPEVDGKTSLLKNVVSLFAAPAPQNLQKGCMNYLIAGTIAPLYQDTEKGAKMPVRWHLVWEDTRYQDGVVPDEEQDYLRINPVSAVEIAAPEQIRCAANTPCPQDGFYFTPAKANSRRHFKQGDIMPSIGNDYGLTIWQWDEQQN